MQVCVPQWPVGVAHQARHPLQKTRVQRSSPVWRGQPAPGRAAWESGPRVRPGRPRGGLGVEPDSSGQICDLQESFPTKWKVNWTERI